MRWRNGLLTASSALVLAGCGGGREAAPPAPPPRIPADVATRLATEAEQVARLTPGSCAARDAAARFRREVISSVGRIPARYREPLLSAANDLAVRLVTCSAPTEAEVKPKGHEKPGEHGHGKKKKKGHDKKGEDEQ
jgi:hypothetical protein